MESNREEGPMTRRRKQQKEQAQKDAKRRRTQFRPSKVIGPRDIQVDLSVGKVKVKVEETDVKQEVEEPLEDVNEVVVKLEEVEVQEDPENDSLEGIMEATGADSTWETQIADKDARIKTLEERVKELEARVTQLENRDKEELEALIDRKLNERGVNLKASQIVGPSELPEEVPMSTSELSSELEPTHDGYLDKGHVSDADKVVEQPNDNKVTKLFPEVAEIIWKKYGNTVLTSKDFLNARLVCTSWSQGVYKISNGPCQFVRQKSLVHFTINCLEKHAAKDANYKLNTITELVPQTQLMINVFRCFVSGCTPLTSKELKAEFNKEVKLIRLLKEYGSNVQFLSLNNDPRDSPFQSWLEWYEPIREVLALLPNLETLELADFVLGNATACSKMVDSQPFPKLGRLQKFNFYYLPVSLMKAALVFNSHITSVEIRLCSDNAVPWIFQDVSLPQLQELRISCVPLHLKQLLQLEASSLQVLKLDLDAYYKWETYDWEMIHEVLKRFQETLTDLELKYTDLLPLLRSFPELPYLTRVKIHCQQDVYLQTRGLEQFEKLELSLPALEYLELIDYHRCRWGSFCFKESNVQWYKFLKTEFVSKLWDLIPKLRIVKINLEYNSSLAKCYNCNFTRLSKYYIRKI